MSKQHMPGANITAQYFVKKYTGSKIEPNVCVLHTTETPSWPGYSGGATAPTMTVRPNFKTQTLEIRQHFPADRSARALVNLAGGVETNTAHAFQIELCGTCDDRYRKSRSAWGTAGVDYIYWPDAPDWALADLAKILRWLNAEWPDFPLKDAAPRGWFAYGKDERQPGREPASYGASRARLTFAEWRAAYGVVGHQHVPENSHGDPGRFPIARLIELATGATTPIDGPDVPPTVPGERAHTVVKGDTLAALAREYDTTVAALATLNGLVNPNVLSVGQTLRVPAAAPTVPAPATEHTVVKGDTLSAIAKTYGTTVANLAAWNSLKDPNRIEPGQVLRLTKPATAEPEPTTPKSQDIRVMVVNAASRNPDVIKAMGPWKGDRVNDLAAYILKHKPDYVGAVELYAADRPLLDSLILGTEPGTYARIGVKGGRVAYLLRGSGVVVGGSVWTDLLPGKGTKYALARKIRFSQGAVGNLSVGHLSYETSAMGVQKRAKEAPAWIAWVRKRFPTDFDLYMGDVNSPAGATTRPDDVGPIFAAYNLRDLRHDTKVSVGKGRYHLIRLFGGLVKAKSITTEPVSFSDHSVVHATVTIPIA